MYLLNIFLVFCLLVLCPSNGFAKKMYKWVDKDGQVHFSDRKPTVETKEIKEYGKDGIKKDEPRDQPEEAGSDFTLKDVDLVMMLGYLTNTHGVMRIGFHYTNRDTDELVYWEEGTVNCECQIYEEVGKRKKRKGRKLVSIEKELQDYDQDIYVDIPDEYLNKGMEGILECLIDTGFVKKRVRTNLSFGGIKKRSPKRRIRGGAISQTLN